MSSLGLDGVLPWAQARQVAASCAAALPGTAARLDEAAGSRLAVDLSTLLDDPATDSARWSGVAVCGEGPWRLIDDRALMPGTGLLVAKGDPVPGHCDAVLPNKFARLRDADLGTWAIAVDRLTGLPDEHARPNLGDGIIRQAAVSRVGALLAPAGRPVTPALLALAASRGHDSVAVVPPPVVGVLILGSSLLDRGLPRPGRPRDALGHAVPAFVGALGARGNPAIRAPDTAALLAREIADAQVDVLITTGSTAPGPDNHLRAVLRDLGAHWLVDGVSVSPGAAMLLARLPDGRHLVGLPGDPIAALAGLITLASPLVSALRGERQAPSGRTAILTEDIAPAEFADDTALVPVEVTASASGLTARPLHPADLTAWAVAGAVAVAPPGAGLGGDVVELLDPFGRGLASEPAGTC